MPLIQGKSPATISTNIAELIRAGHDPKQAAAIAYNVAEDDARAAGVIFRNPAGEVLCLLRGAESADYPRTWAFPGGGIEDGETPEQAAIRECMEEIGQTPDPGLQLVNWDDGFVTYLQDVPETFRPTLNNEHTGYLWVDPASLPQPMHPGALLTLAQLPQPGAAMDSKSIDTNGWAEYRDVRISKVGVFPYLGRQLGLTGPEAGQIFQVLRPEEELSKPECVASFKLIPWIDEHVMLGPVATQVMPQSSVPAERKGVQGTTGEEVYFKGGGLFANIKAFADTLAQLIASGKRELSAGYLCKWVREAGVFDGKPYQFVQRNIRGNHLALVREGRMGPDVAIMDGLTVCYDSIEDLTMADETTSTPPADIGAAVEAIKAAVAPLADLLKTLAPLLGAAETTETAASGGTADAGTVAGAAPAAGATTAAPAAAQPAAMDAAIAEMRGQIETLTKAQADGERHFVQRLAQRNALVAQISGHVGVFDHALMTLDEVTAYGCDKLGIKAEPAARGAALTAYLQAKPAATPAATVAMDSADKSSPSLRDQATQRKGA